MTIETERIAALVMCWLRFAKQHTYVAREAGHFSADVLGTNLKTIVEVEVKVSISDLRNDKKKSKHSFYASEDNQRGNEGASVPHQFYYAVPEIMKDAAIDFVQGLNKNYGVLILSTQLHSGGDWNSWKRLILAKRANRLHKGKVSDGLRTLLASRMASDLCRMHLHRQMHNDYVTMARQVSKEVENYPNIEEKQKLRK